MVHVYTVMLWHNTTESSGPAENFECNQGVICGFLIMQAYQSLLYLYFGVPFGKNDTTVPSTGSILADVNTTFRCEGLV